MSIVPLCMYSSTTRLLGRTTHRISHLHIIRLCAASREDGPALLALGLQLLLDVSWLRISTGEHQ